MADPIECFANQSSFWIDPQGYVRPCARFQSPMEHVSTFSDFSQVTQSQAYRALRADHSLGEWPKACVRCKEDETLGFSSKRQFYQRLGLKAGQDFMIDISVGNFCNLKCRMCNPYNSTSWNSDYKALENDNLVKPLSDQRKTKGYILDATDEDRLLDFVSQVPGRVALELKGGEPLIMPQVPKLMERLSQLPNAKNIHILLVTNGTVAPDWVETLSEKIGSVDLHVSIDGLYELYDYIRGNEEGGFEKCDENIRRFQSMKNITLRFNVVAQNLNAHQLVDIAGYLNSNFNDNINFITLSYPKYYRLNNIPPKARVRLLEGYETRKTSISLKHRRRFDNMFAWLKHDFDQQIYNKFISISRRLDELRSQKLADVAPHLTFN